MKKTNEINSELSIEERKKKIIEFIEKQAPEKKKAGLLMPFINEIKLMLEKKISINFWLEKKYFVFIFFQPDSTAG